MGMLLFKLFSVLATQKDDTENKTNELTGKTSSIPKVNPDTLGTETEEKKSNEEIPNRTEDKEDIHKNTGVKEKGNVPVAEKGKVYEEQREMRLEGPTEDLKNEDLKNKKDDTSKNDLEDRFDSIQ